jgi:hypothetical protein
MIAMTVGEEDLGDFARFDAGGFLDGELGRFTAVKEPCAAATTTIAIPSRGVTSCICFTTIILSTASSVVYRRVQPPSPIQS